MTTLSINWRNAGFEFEAEDFIIDGNTKLGPSPMKMLLYAAASCAAIDVVDILTKMRFEIEALSVKVQAERAEGDAGRPWKSIHLQFEVSGDIPKSKIQRAIDLSMDKYCSVAMNLRPTTEITAELV